MPIYEFDGMRVTLPASGNFYVADTAVVIGNVTLGEDVSIWFNAVIRGDNDAITIGSGSNVQDGSVLHVDPGFPIVIGDDVTIGHMAMVHGCTIHDRGFVGLGAIVMNKAVIGSDAMLAAGAMLTERKVMAPRELWAGRPAVKLKDLNDAAIAGMRLGAAHYAENAKAHAEAVAAALG